MSMKTENVRYIRTDTISCMVNTMSTKFDNALSGHKTVLKYALCWDLMKDVLCEMKENEETRAKSECILNMMKAVERNVEKFDVKKKKNEKGE